MEAIVNCGRENFYSFMGVLNAVGNLVGTLFGAGVGSYEYLKTSF